MLTVRVNPITQMIKCDLNAVIQDNEIDPVLCASIREDALCVKLMWYYLYFTYRPNSPTLGSATRQGEVRVR